MPPPLLQEIKPRLLVSTSRTENLSVQINFFVDMGGKYSLKTRPIRVRIVQCGEANLLSKEIASGGVPVKKLLMVGIFIFVFDIVGGTTISKLGHHNSINFLKSDGNYLLSMDELEYWVLWDTNTKSQVLSGNLSVDIGKNLDLQNGIFVVSAQNGFDLY